jgi:cyclopropane fatty-acyl-phospholipid synthase-like methyltransferase
VMKPGPAMRKLMPPKVERRMAAMYRAVFVDLEKVARLLAQHLPQDARLLDIGGGDGELVNHLLDSRTDVSVSMVDVAESVGKFITPANRLRVVLHPRTSIESHADGLRAHYDAALVSDVVHHLPVNYRADFIKSVYSAIVSGGPMFIKDIEPGHPIASLSLFCDKYVSGDRGVELISMDKLRTLGAKQLPEHVSTEIGLYPIDRPNYMLKFDFAYSPMHQERP